MKINVIVWTCEGEATYIAAYIGGSPPHMMLELSSVHIEGEELYGLTTCSTKDGQTLPETPGSWLQSFTVGSIAELWDHHQEALKFLLASGHMPPKPANADLVGHFSITLRGQSKHIRSLTLWPLRVPYWYFIRRNTRHDKPIQQLLKG